ncbi:sugar transferase [Cohnella fermenti]|uniref:Sugar transferase n=1 Tax=Cohnella fermenti TaxID=2565925 RepID=A0A4S4BJ66_9BACL|nr:sugar transferase [Cohnella fermenti]THF74692.1 sugar transferase [Cohnella fermenti]
MNEVDMQASWTADAAYAVPGKAYAAEKRDRAKRLVDVMVASAGLLAVLPAMLIVAMLIKLEDPRGPIFFGQIRVGKNGRRFRIYKFRSMVTDAEKRLEQLLEKNDISGAMFKMKNDPRITRIGRLLRRTSIDELPQLWNVLRGDMSIVGPRPPLEREVAMYSERELLRLTVVPGCTGLWQISGRNHLSFHEMVELDLKYIEKRSVRFDLYIMWRTVRMLLGAKDAY